MDAEWVRGNSLTIEQIFVNLLLNAAQAFTDRGHVRIIAERMPLTNPGAQAPTIRVRVVDDGPGVPERLRSSIFDPFFTTRDEGTGLGLTNALEAAQSSEGRLVLESSESGASFAVYLPESPPGRPRSSRPPSMNT